LQTCAALQRNFKFPERWRARNGTCPEAEKNAMARGAAGKVRASFCEQKEAKKLC
jgi:hypothetical protein